LHEQQDNGRQAQLRVAAEALVEWMHVRRATWSSEAVEGIGGTKFSGTADVDDVERFSSSPPFDAPPAFTVRAPQFDAPPVFAPSSWPDESVTFDVAAILDAAPPVAVPKKPRVPLKLPVDAVRSLAAPLFRAARRAAPALAMLAVVVGAGWLARPYVGNVKTWLTSLTEKAPPPKATPVAAAAKTTPPPGARRTGLLMARSEPPGAIVLVDGKERGVTPLTLNDLTAGSHTVVLQSDKGSVRRTVTIAADRTALVSESIFAGWLAVFSPFEVQISEGALAIRLDETSKVLLSPGPHDLRFENRELGYRETRRVEVQPGETTSLSIVASPSTLTVTANAPASVTIDGQQVGGTPLTSHPIALGTREIVVKDADGNERRFTQKVTVAPVQIDVDFTQP
jgi:hypothetical protein